jgi:hypothetical protein
METPETTVVCSILLPLVFLEFLEEWFAREKSAPPPPDMKRDIFLGSIWWRSLSIKREREQNK